MLKHLLPMIPEHTCYVEVFGGGGALLCAKERSSVEVWNDLNGDLVNLFRQAKYHPDALCNELDLVLNSRQEFFDRQPPYGLTEIQRAVNWYLNNAFCFGGSSKTSYGYSRKSGGTSTASRGNRLEAIRNFSQRLDKVNVEHLDWRDCLKRYDVEGSFFFCDPPYLTGNAKIYSPWKPEDLMQLRDELVGLKGKWLVTICDCKESREVFQGFDIQPVERQNGIENRAERKRNGGQFGELIVASR